MLSLLPNHIHLWQISLDSISSLETYYAILPVDEKKRADRFVFDKHRQRFILAHFGLRKILSGYLNIAPEKIQFETLSHGKPQIHQDQRYYQYRTPINQFIHHEAQDWTPIKHSLEFNLSHSEDVALLGIRTEKMIGVDIEYHQDREFLGIAEHVFSEKECQILAGLSDPLQIQSFFHVWAQKEAFIKAIGQGLSYPLKTLTVASLPPAGIIEKNDAHPDLNDWYMHSFQPNPHCQAAVATLNPIEKITFFDFIYDRHSGMITTHER